MTRSSTAARPHMDDARRHLRHPLQLSGRALAGAGDAIAIQVEDLSLAGFGAIFDRPLAHGTRITLSINAARGIDATVLWSEGTRHGCAFQTTLHPMIFQHLMMLSGTRI